MVLEKTPESPLDCKEIKPVNPKGNQSWIFIGRTDAEAQTPVLYPPDAKNWLIGKDPDAGNDWQREEKGTTEDEMVGWHHWLNGHKFEEGLKDGDGQGRLACCSPWGCKELDTTQRLNWTELNGAFLVVQMVKNLPAMQETLVQFLCQKIHWRRDRLPIPVFLGFPSGSAGKESGLGSIPGLGRSPGEGKGYPLQYSSLEHSMELTVAEIMNSLLPNTE